MSQENQWITLIGGLYALVSVLACPGCDKRRVLFYIKAHSVTAVNV